MDSRSMPAMEGGGGVLLPVHVPEVPSLEYEEPPGSVKPGGDGVLLACNPLWRTALLCKPAFWDDRPMANESPRSVIVKLSAVMWLV